MKHLTPDELAAYIDGHLDREAEKHLLECHKCATALSELARITKEIDNSVRIPSNDWFSKAHSILGAKVMKIGNIISVSSIAAAILVTVFIGLIVAIPQELPTTVVTPGVPGNPIKGPTMEPIVSPNYPGFSHSVSANQPDTVTGADITQVMKIGDKLMAFVGLRKAASGTLKVALTNGQVFTKKIDSKRPTVEVFEFPGLQNDQKLAVSFNQEEWQEDPNLLEVTDQDMSILTGERLIPDSQATMRIVLFGISTTGYVPLRNVNVDVILKDKKLFNGRTDDTGTLVCSFKIPDLAEGDYELIVRATSQIKTSEQKLPMKVKSEYRILLVTDKPLYQPGHEIHLRALILSQFDLKPLAQKELLFEIEDAKANKVFKKKVMTSDFGIASCKFQLADEVAMGEYKITAMVDKIRTEKTVTVKRYVLPRFEVNIDVEKKFFMPKEIIKGTIIAKYTFGKPVTNAEVTIEAATFDVEFKNFAKVTLSKTNADGKTEFEVQLPDYFVGQPLDKGNAIVKLEISVKDTADHVEKKTVTYSVVNQPVKLTLVAESGRVVPGVENQVYVLATYPDGTPASVEFIIKGGSIDIKGTTDSKSGFATVSILPQTSDFKQGQYIYNTGIFTPTGVYYPDQNYHMIFIDLDVTARDKKGAVATQKVQLSSDPMRDNMLLRLDKAVYKGSSPVQMDIFTAGTGGTVYIDIIKNRQTILTHSVDVEKGRARYKWDVPQDIFGTVEIHAYQLLSSSGVFMRDTRVIYINPASELKINITPEHSEYRPRNATKDNPFGSETFLKFQVTDKFGNPVKSAIGVIIVDTAVYALQEMQPGLEKVYFTLEQELQNPKYELKNAPITLPEVLKEKEELEGKRQEVAKAILANVEPLTQAPGAPSKENANLVNNLRNIYHELQNQILYNNNNSFKFEKKGLRIDYTKETKEWISQHWAVKQSNLKYEQVIRYMPYFKPEFAAKQIFEFRKQQKWYEIVQRLDKELFEPGTYNFTEWAKKDGVKDALDNFVTIEEIAKTDPVFSPENIGKALTNYRKNAIWNQLVQIFQNLEDILTDDRSAFKKDAISKLGLSDNRTRDAKGETIKIESIISVDDLKRVVASKQWWKICETMWGHLNYDQSKYYDNKNNAYRLPEDILSTLVTKGLIKWELLKDPWGGKIAIQKVAKPVWCAYFGMTFTPLVMAGPDRKLGTSDDITSMNHYYYYADRTKWTGDVRLPMGSYLYEMERLEKKLSTRDYSSTGPYFTPSNWGSDKVKELKDEKRNRGDEGGTSEVKPIFVREWFPETLIFEPELVTNDKGEATLKMKIADSITTWKLTASASSMGGKLGSASADIRVFQDFFIEPDLPVALTQNDEISIPIAVYNYLPTSQRIRLVFEPVGEEWFESTDSSEKIVQVASNEVRAVYFRIKTVKIGDAQSLKVTAYGNKMSDAVKKTVRVEPNGKMFELVKNDRLSNTKLSLDIPQNAIDGSCKILFKCYPGIYTQVLEGVEGILSAPHG